MDSTLKRLVEFSLDASYASLAPETVHECRRRLIDTFASAMAAYDDPLCRSVRNLARRYSGSPEAGVWGSSLQTTVEWSAFANGVALRFLDINDTYLSKSKGHPSDMLSGILAVADHLRADGPSVINAMALAYDVYCSFSDSVDINCRGWDQAVYATFGAAVGVGKLMRLRKEQLANAISLSLTPNMSLRQIRCGDLSAWKGCAGGNAARNAVFAALLAKEGVTGPAEIFEGENGLWNVVGRFDWKLPEPGRHLIGETHIKTLPICYHAQSAALAALELRSRVNPSDIATIAIESYGAAVSMTGGDPTRWAPATRETADHSMPYVVALALLDGRVTAQSFSDDRMKDAGVLAFMKKITVTESAELSAMHPEGAPSRLTIRMVNGQVVTNIVRYPKGHARNPLTDADVERKFLDVFEELGDTYQGEAALEALRNFEHVRDVKSEVIRRFAIRPEQ